MLTIEGVLALHHAHLRALAQRSGRLHQRGGHLKIRHRRILDGRVFPAGMLEADSAGGDDHIAAAHIKIDAAAGAHPDKGIRADVVQLLHSDRGGGPADAGGADGHLLAQQRAGIDGVLPVLGHEMRVVKQRGDLLAPAGIAGQDHVAAHIALYAANMKLFFQLLHNTPPDDNKTL